MKRPPRVQRVCRHCSMCFTAYPADVKRGGGIYCSRSCGRLAQGKPSVAHVCHQCKRTFMVRAWDHERGRGTYCSRGCASAARMPRGAANPYFKHGLTRKTPPPELVLRAYVAVRTAVKTGRLIRKPCEVCGATNHVQAHHVDYRFPLVVEWLCITHHRARHRELRLAVSEVAS